MDAESAEKVRRQVYNLTVSDLNRFPAWQFALDEEGVEAQDEATVRPHTKTPVDPQEGLVIVRARFRLRDGSEFTGYIYPPPPGEVWDVTLIQPVLIVADEQIPFWRGIDAPTVEAAIKGLKTAIKMNEDIFPIGYKTDVEITTGNLTGTIDGLYYFKDWKLTLATT